MGNTNGPAWQSVDSEASSHDQTPNFHVCNWFLLAGAVARRQNDPRLMQVLWDDMARQVRPPPLGIPHNIIGVLRSQRAQPWKRGGR